MLKRTIGVLGALCAIQACDEEPEWAEDAGDLMSEVVGPPPPPMCTYALTLERAQATSPEPGGDNVLEFSAEFLASGLARQDRVVWPDGLPSVSLTVGVQSWSKVPLLIEHVPVGSVVPLRWRVRAEEQDPGAAPSRARGSGQFQLLAQGRGARSFGPAQLLFPDGSAVEVEWLVSWSCSNQPSWGPWLNRDNPGGSGDFETIVDFGPGQVCADPLAIQCRTVQGVRWPAAGDVYNCNVVIGGYCYNSHQQDLSCEDYEVRFLCP